ncbi:hypothetical protein CTAYLR_002853 [Chrysophaeum taylorii]|uniref:ferredoxin:thioredoxin reductase n=1 Tax=Chrysophaeum taylorii TaxID=2483200 RepID=A0AAD7U7X3_9STRA|nr:hypothetical protein CTAYLR_002853 [Chrysophaeum taylorii]
MRWFLSLLVGFAATGAAFITRGARVPATRREAKPAADDVDEGEFEKALAAMTSFSNRYVKLSKTKYCAEPSVTSVVIRGLAEHKVALGAPLCPCRFYECKESEAKDGYWNCPCVPMRERKECHCMLFLTDDNDFVGESTDITVDEITALTAM